MSARRGVFVTGGAGYIGSVLIPHLLEAGYEVICFDRYYFGRTHLPVDDRVHLVEGDVRDVPAVAQALARYRPEFFIHLAAVSNDPSSDISPEITKSINLDALSGLADAAKQGGVRRFLYASSASVYGVKPQSDVTEELALEPMTLYAKYKAEGEKILNAKAADDFVVTSVRSATVCGYSPRLRLDLTVNILTNQALTQPQLTVFGGSQMRPNVHVKDLCDFYILLLSADISRIQQQAFNVCFGNASVRELAELVRREVNPTLPIAVTPTNDMRSYHLSAAKAQRELGFVARRRIETAVADLQKAYQDGQVTAPTNPQHRNVEWMKLHPGDWKWSR